MSLHAEIARRMTTANAREWAEHHGAISQAWFVITAILRPAGIDLPDREPRKTLIREIEDRFDSLLAADDSKAPDHNFR